MRDGFNRGLEQAVHMLYTVKLPLRVNYSLHLDVDDGTYKFGKEGLSEGFCSPGSQSNCSLSLQIQYVPSLPKKS